MSAGVFVLPLLSLLIVLNARSLGIMLGVMDHPNGHKTHSTPTPLVGGLAVILPFLAFSSYCYFQRQDILVLAILVVAVGGAFLLGFFDDRYDVSPHLRLWAKALWILGCMMILPQFVVEQFDITFMPQPIGLGLMSIPFSVLVLVGLTNAINMADGMNGLVCGLCLIWLLLLTFYAPPYLTGLLLLVVLCLLITLAFNLMGKLFLGDSGSYGLGIMIGLLSVYIYNSTSSRLPADVVAVWFFVPVIDCLRVMADRIIRQRQSPMYPDQNHLHHRLQLLFPKWLTLVAYWTLVALPAALMIAEPGFATIFLMTIFVIYLGVLMLSTQAGMARLNLLNKSALPTFTQRKGRSFRGQRAPQARKSAPSGSLQPRLSFRRPAVKTEDSSSD